jgi:hypothetical protein
MVKIIQKIKKSTNCGNLNYSKIEKKISKISFASSITSSRNSNVLYSEGVELHSEVNISSTASTPSFSAEGSGISYSVVLDIRSTGLLCFSFHITYSSLASML